MLSNWSTPLSAGTSHAVPAASQYKWVVVVSYQTPKIRAKTGTLRDVKALSGYLFIDGEPAIAFAMIANDLKTPGTAWPVFEKVLGLVTEEIQ